MSIRFFVAHSILALSMLGITAARAQTVPPNSPATAPPIASGMPDACKLMPQSDLETLFPARPVSNKGHTLSPIYKGPQYVESCQYVVKLPSPTSKLEVSKFAALTIIRWGAQSKSQADVVQTFASMRDTREKVGSEAQQGHWAPDWRRRRGLSRDVGLRGRYSRPQGRPDLLPDAGQVFSANPAEMRSLWPARWPIAGATARWSKLTAPLRQTTASKSLPTRGRRGQPRRTSGQTPAHCSSRRTSARYSAT